MNIGLALGSGSARGWAHIGIITALADLGIHPNIVCGTSIGSLVGASYVSNNLKELEQWSHSLTKMDVVKFFKFNASLNGLVNKRKLHHFLNKYVTRDSSLIENFTKKYASVATELVSGREVWLSQGPLIDAVWSSIALPGLFPAIKVNEQWLVDGGLVNPVPISTCRALGADIVIAVDLNNMTNEKDSSPQEYIEKKYATESGRVSSLIKEYATSAFYSTKSEDKPPSLFNAITGSINIVQARIASTRMSEEPPDILLSPMLSNIGLLDFHLAKDSITEGKKSVFTRRGELEHLLNCILEPVKTTV